MTRLNVGNIRHPDGTNDNISLTSTGRVGIGTSSPAALLEASSATGSATPTPTEIRLSSTTNAADWSTTDPWARVGFYSADTTGGARLRGAIDTIQTFSNGNVSSLAFKLDDASTGLVERMRVTYEGKVGIGTTSPSAALHVAAANNSQVFIAATDANPTTIIIDTDAGSSERVRINNKDGALTFDTNNSSERARIDSSGRLLVGTSSTLAGATDSLLQIRGNSSGTQFAGKVALATDVAAGSIVSGTDLGAIYFGNVANGIGGLIECKGDAQWGTNDYPGRLVFSTTADGASSPTERMRIDNLGVTTITSVANNSYGLQVYSNGTSGQQYGVYIKTNSDQADTTRNFLECIGGPTTRAVIRSNGGLANFSANNANLSDRNAKKDISPAAGTWDCIKEWEIVNYRYKDQPDDADLNLGVIAQQVAESCPEVITVFSEAKDAKPAVLDDEGNEVEPAQEAQPEKLGIKEQQMYWMAIKALQEAQVRIETLEAEVAALKAQ